MIFTIGYILFNQFNKGNILENKETKYKLEKFAESGTQFNERSKIIEKNGIYFLTTEFESYLKIYNENGENISPKEIDNIKLKTSKVEKNEDFLGYIVIIDNKVYYIDEMGKIVFYKEATNAQALSGYININSDEICYKSDYHYSSDEYCSMIYDLKGNLLIDGKKEKYYSPRVIYDENDNPLFMILKDKKHGIIDNENKIIINFEYMQFDYIENSNIIIAKKNENLIDIYDLKGNLLKNINLKDIKKYEVKDKYARTYSEYSVYINDTIYLIDNSYNLKEYSNIYHKNNGQLGINGEYEEIFYITDYIYIKDNNGIYTIHNLKGEKIIDEEFKFVGSSNPNGSVTISNEYFALCKNLDRTECGAIDYQGNILLNFENEINDYNKNIDGDVDLSFYGFKNNNNYFNIVDGKVTKKITCINNQINSNNRIIEYNKNTITIDDESLNFDDGGRKIIDYNCNDLSTAKYHNIHEYNDFILAQNTDWITYDVYDTNGILIDDKNVDKNKLKNFLGYSERKLYFNYGNNIYVLQEK